MTLQNKFRLLLAVFGVSVVANVLVSVWCISVYVDSAITQFTVHMSGMSKIRLARGVVDALISDLEHRPRLSPEERDSRYREQCGEIDRRVQSVLRDAAASPDPRIRSRLATLCEALWSVSERYVQLVDQSRFDEAAELLRTEIKETFAGDLHRLLATLEVSHDQAITQTAADIEQTRSNVTALLAANAAAAFLLSAIGVFLVRNWVLKPVETLKKAAEEHASGNLRYRIDKHANDELGTLSREVNRMADSLLDIQKRLVQQERLAALGEVASTVAHNIRNPLAGIRASAQSTLSETANSSPTHRQQMRIVETVDSLNQWVKQLLLVNQPLELHCRQTPVRELVDAVLKVQRSNAERCGVSFSYDEPFGTCSVFVDPRHLEQAIQIVVDNAIDAAPRDSEIAITAECDAGSDRWVELRVRDHGAGIPEEVRDRIASPYFTTKPGGTGIGLHLAKKAVESHGGEIRFEPPASGGTAVTLRLPARDFLGAGDGENPSR